METKIADWLSGALCVLYLGVMLLVATGYQGSVRNLVGSEVTATWAGAVGTILAVVSGFALARKQSRNQAALALAAERRGTAAKLRSAAMLVKHAHTHLEGVLQYIAKVDYPQAYAQAALDGGLFKGDAFTSLSAIDVANIPVPSAIDAITAARGMVSLLEQKLRAFATNSVPPVELVELQRLCRAISAHFVSVAKLSEHFEPDWPTPPDFYVDSSVANPHFPTRI